MSTFQDPNFYVPLIIAVVFLFINIFQQLTHRRTKHKIEVWAKNAKSITESIVDIQEDIKNKKVSSFADISNTLDTLANFADGMYISMEDELGKKRKSISK